MTWGLVALFQGSPGESKGVPWCHFMLRAPLGCPLVEHQTLRRVFELSSMVEEGKKNVVVKSPELV